MLNNSFWQRIIRHRHIQSARRPRRGRSARLDWPLAAIERLEERTLLSSVVTVGPEQLVNTFTTGDQQTNRNAAIPNVGIAADGSYVVTWISEGQDGSGKGIFAQRFDANGATLGNEFQVNRDTTAGDQTDPAIAVAADTGEFLISWTSFDSELGIDSIFAQRFDAQGNTVGDEFRVNSSQTESKRTSTVAMSANGESIIAWSSPFVNGFRSIYARRFDAAGNAVGDEFRVSEYTLGEQRLPAVSIADSGESVISWDSAYEDGDDYGVFARRFDTLGNAHGDVFQVNQETSEQQGVSSVAMTDSGEFVITWRSFLQDGDLNGIYARRFDAGGVALGDEFQVNTFVTSQQTISSVSMSDAGEFLITWSSLAQDGSGYGIYAQRFDAHGDALGSEFRVNTTTTLHQWFSTVALNNAGQFVIVWASEGQDGSGFGVYAQRFVTDVPEITPVGGEQQVNTFTPGNQRTSIFSPNVGVAADGSYVVTWESYLPDGSDGGVYAQRYDANGNAVGDEFQVNSTTANLPTNTSASMADTGEFLITWESLNQEGSNWDVYGRRYDANGDAVGSEFQVNSTIAGDQRYASASMAATGEFVITWTSANPDFTDYGVYAQLYDAAGTAVGGEFQVNSYTTGNQQISSVSMSATGEFVITWTSSGQDGSVNGVYAQLYDAAGNAVGDEFQVNSYTTGDQLYSSVSMSASGAFVITWTSSNQDGNSNGVYAQRYDANGDAVGDEFQVNSYTTGNQIFSSVSMSATGAFVIVWTSSGQDGSGNGVYAQLYDAAGNAVGDEFQVNSYTAGNQAFSSISMSATGAFVITWTSFDQDGSGSGVYAQRFSLNSPWLTTVGREQQVNTFTLNEQRTSVLSTNVGHAADGSYVVTWSSNLQDGIGYGVYAQRYDANGDAVGDEFQVNSTTDGDQVSATVSVAATGEFVIAWTSSGQDGSGEGVYAQRYDANGDRVGGEFLVNSTTDGDQSNASVSMAATGEFVFTWTSSGQDGSGDGVYAQLYDAAGNAVGGEFLVNSYTTGNQQISSVSMSATGDFVITWTSFDQDGSGSGVYAQLYDAAGNAVGGEFLVNSTTDDFQLYSSVSMSATGEFVIAWQSRDVVVGNYNVYAQLYDAAGNAVGGEFQVNSTTVDEQTLASAAMADSGEFVITWQSREFPGDYNVFARLYDASGNAAGGEFQVNKPIGLQADGSYVGDQRYASASMSATGELVITWTSFAQDGSGNGVFAQRYRIDAPNQLPDVTADSGTITVSEGDTAFNTGVFSDPEDQPVTLTASVGSVLDNGDGTWNWSWDTSDGPEDSQVVTITATDQRGAATEVTFDLTVENVAPIITGLTDTSTTPGSPITLSASISDPGDDAPLSIVWDLGDGTIINDLTEVTHTYATDGEYFASLTVTDTDGAQTVQEFRVVIAPPVTITASQTVIEESAVIRVGSENQVNTYTTGTQKTTDLAKSVAIADDGRYVVTWSSYLQDGSGYGVYAQLFAADGIPDGGEFRVNTFTSGHQDEPEVAITPTGEFVITWTSSNQDGSLLGVYAQRYDADGNAVGGEFRVNSYTAGNQYRPTVAMAASGEFVIAWHSSNQDGSGSNVYAQRYDADGNAVGGEFRVNSYTASNQDYPSVAMASSGEFVITWSSYSQDGSDYSVYAQLFAADGSPVGDEFPVNTYTTGPQRFPTVAMGDSGAFVVAWESYQQDGSLQGIYAQSFDPDGNPLGDEVQVNSHTPDDQFFSSVSTVGTGDFIVTWASKRQDDSAQSIYAQRFDENGNRLGEEFRVYSDPSGFSRWQGFPSIAGNGNGQLVVVWTGDAQDGDSVGVFAQRFSLASDQVELTATIDNALAEDVIIPLSWTGTAVPGIDFEEVGQSGTAPAEIVILAGETSGSVKIRNSEDRLDEYTETLSVHFGVPANASLASADPIDLQLLDDDPEPAVFLSSVGQTLDEQDLAVPVTVSLSEVSGRDVTVHLSSSGSATAGADYRFEDTVVVIPAGQLQAGTVLQLLDDDLGESAETIQVSIDSADFATIPATSEQPDSLTHLITQNDAPTMQFASLLKQVSETAGTYSTLLTLSNAADAPITTTVTLTGDAVVGDDYASAAGTSFDVTFDPGETEKAITVTLIDDNQVESDETLRFETSNLLGSPIVHQARIIDDDDTFVMVTTTPARVWEDEGLVTVTATLSKAYEASSGIDVLVPVSFSSDLRYEVDYFADTNPILIPAGATSATRGIVIVDNNVAGTDELITVKVGDPTNARLRGFEDVPVVVQDNDPLVSFDRFGATPTAQTITVNEDSGVVRIPVFLDKPVNRDVVVPVSVYSTQMDSSEYTLLTNSVRIDEGTTQGFVEVQINDDSTFEGRSVESLTVKLGTGAGFTLDGTSLARTRTLRVIDDEAAPVPIWKRSEVKTMEGDQPAPTLKLSGPSDVPVTVDIVIESPYTNLINPASDLSIPGFVLNTRNITILGKRLYSTYSYRGSVTFKPGETELPLKITILDNDFPEDREVFRVTASGPVSGSDSFDLVIYDNDAVQQPASSSGGGGGIIENTVEAWRNVEQIFSSQNPFKLTAADGFIDGATAFFDANFNQVPDFVDTNGNGVFDEGELLEPVAESGYDGLAVLPPLADFDLNQNGVIDPAEGQFVVRDGVDSSTGQPLLVPLVAPIGYSVASPLSTLVAASAEAQGSEIPAAESRVAGALGIPEPAYLRAPLIPLTQSGDVVAARTFATTAQVYGTASQMASFISGLNNSIATDLAGRLVFAEMASALLEPGALLDLTEPVVVDSLLRGAIARSGATPPAEEALSTAVDVIVALNQQIAAIPVEATRTWLESVAAVQVLANGDAPEALAELAAGTMTSSEIQSGWLGTALQQRVDEAEIQNVVVPYIVTEDAQIIEGDAGETLLEVDVTLSDPSNLPVTVNYATLDFTAAAGEDYDSVAGQLSWAAGETTTHTLQIPIFSDTNFEGDELFYLALTNPVNSAVVQTLTRLTITDDDVATVTADAPTGDLSYLIETDANAISVEENGEVLFRGTLVDTPVLTIEGSSGVRNDFLFRAGLDPVSPLNGFHFAGAGPDDTLTIDPQFAESIEHIVTGSGQGRFIVNGVTLSYENIHNIDSPASPVFAEIPDTPPEYGDLLTLSISVPVFDSAVSTDASWSLVRDDVVLESGTGQTATLTDIGVGTYRMEFVAVQQGRLPAAITYEFEVLNAPPVVVDDTFTTSEDETLTVAADHGLLSNDFDPEGTPVTLLKIAGETVAANGETTIALSSGATLVVSADGAMTYDPGLLLQSLAFGEQVIESLSYQVADATGLVSSGTAEITVAGRNDPPAVGADNPSVVVDEGQQAQNHGTFSDIDIPDSVSLSASIGTVVDNSDGTWGWSWDTSDGPVESQTVTITATDSSGSESTATFELTVRNVAPTVALSGPASASEGETHSYTFTTSDPGADTFALLSITAGPAATVSNQSFDTATGNGSFDVTFHDGPNTTSVSVQVEDSDGAGSNMDTIDVMVANVAPTLAAPGAVYEIVENSANGTSVATIVADDPGADTLTYAITGGSGATAFAIDAVTGEITVADSAQLDFETTQSFTLEIKVSDEDAASDTTSVRIDLLNQASITGTVYVDTNQNGLMDANEVGIDGVTIELLDETDAVVGTTETSDGGFYLFEDYERGRYRIRQVQPTGVDDGEESLGSLGGTIVSNDVMELTLERIDAEFYDFAELGQSISNGDAASIGFWQNKHGQALIAQGGANLAQWLSDSFSNVFGNEFVDDVTGVADVTGADVAAFYKEQLFKQKAKKSAGPAKVDAQFMAVALAVYFTSESLSGSTVAADYGFNVTDTGIGTKIVNVGSSGAAFGVADHTDLTIMQLLAATNAMTDLPDAQSGFAYAYDKNGDGVIDSAESLLRRMANDIFSLINEQGDI